MIRYRVISEAKPCFDFYTEDEQKAEETALRVAVITGRTAYVREEHLLPLTPEQAHALIKACEAINSTYVSGTGEYLQEEMEVAAALVPALTEIAQEVTL